MAKNKPLTYLGPGNVTTINLGALWAGNLYRGFTVGKCFLRSLRRQYLNLEDAFS